MSRTEFNRRTSRVVSFDPTTSGFHVRECFILLRTNAQGGRPPATCVVLRPVPIASNVNLALNLLSNHFPRNRQRNSSRHEAIERGSLAEDENMTNLTQEERLEPDRFPNDAPANAAKTEEPEQPTNDVSVKLDPDQPVNEASVTPGTTKDNHARQETRGRKTIEEAKKRQEEEKKRKVKKALAAMQKLLNLSGVYCEFLRTRLETTPTPTTSQQPLVKRGRKRTKNETTSVLQESSPGNATALQDTPRPSTSSHNDDIIDNNNTPRKLFAESKQIEVSKKLKYLTGGTLRPYQLEGVAWLVTLHEGTSNGILADEMGVGKTLQVIALICHLYECRIRGPFLIVAPFSTIPNWKMEFEKFAPEIPVVVLHGSKAERRQQVIEMEKSYDLDGRKVAPVVVTPYHYPVLEFSALEKQTWEYIIVDEGHRIKNFHCQLAGILRTIKSKNRLLLTGTPLQNNITELWSLCNFLMPEVFYDENTFSALLELEDLKDAETFIQKEKTTNVISNLHKILKPFMLRRVKKDVLPYLVGKKEVVIWCPMTEMQRMVYSDILTRNIKRLQNPELEDEKKHDPDEPLPKRKCTLKRGRSESLDTSPDRSTLLVEKPKGLEYASNVKMQHIHMLLRKVVNHPYLIQFPLDPEKSKPDNKVLLIDEKLITQSGKMLVLDSLLARLKKRGHKVLLFSTFVIFLDIIEDFLEMRKYKYRRLDGSTSLNDRRQFIDEFNNDKEIFVFMISTRAGGLGLNLVGADTVIFVDRDWNPQVDIQAQDRCHRIGQTRPVVIYSLICRNTYDERILNHGEVKRRLEKLVIANGKFKNVNSVDRSHVLADLIALREMLKSEERLMIENTEKLGISEAEWEKLLDRSDLMGIPNSNSDNKENESKKLL